MTRNKYLFSFLVLLIILSTCLAFFLYSPKHSPSLKIEPRSFSELPGWQSTQALVSLRTFQVSCRYLLKQPPSQPVGNRWFGLQAKDWYPACAAASNLVSPSEAEAKQFFETWFQPVEFATGQALTGLFTGYYLPSIPASLNKTQAYSVPIYGVPNNLIQINLRDFDPALPARKLVGRLHHKQLLPFYSRKEVDEGAIANTAPILAYVHTSFERLLIEIQGSATLSLNDGTRLHLGYAAKNGLPYTPIGRVLIERKILPADKVSLQSIRAYLNSHPEEQEEIIHQNRSFVFFEILPEAGAFGTQGTPLTQGYSLAVDPEWVPLGMPVWLSTTYPDPHSNTQHTFHRLMIAQDTGGAIKGIVRGDIYWGDSDEAAEIAGKMRSRGRYWLLVPNLARLNLQRITLTT